MRFHQQPSGFLSDEHDMCVGKIKAHVSNLHPESVVTQVLEGHEVVSSLEGDPSDRIPDLHLPSMILALD